MICQNCKAELKENSKFCSVCGTKREKKSFCSNCGTQLKTNTKFCVNCGNQINNSTQSNPTQTKKLSSTVNKKQKNNRSDSKLDSQIKMNLLITAFVAGKSENTDSHAIRHYLQAFNKFIANGGKKVFSWNMGAFFFNYSTLFWRKMNNKGGKFFLANLFSMFADKKINQITNSKSSKISIFYGLFIGPYLACNTDYWYFEKFNNHLQEAQNMYPSDFESQLTYLRKKGGTAKWVIIPNIIAFLLFFLLIIGGGYVILYFCSETGVPIKSFIYYAYHPWQLVEDIIIAINNGTF